MRVFTKQSSFYCCVKLVQGVCSPHQLPLWQGGSDPTGPHVVYIISIFACALPADPTSVPRTTYHVSRILCLVPRTSNFVPCTSHHAPRIWHITPHISFIIVWPKYLTSLKSGVSNNMIGKKHFSRLLSENDKNIWNPMVLE
jgi:hypothetical protein